MPQSSPIFNEILAAHPDWRAEMFLEIRATINQADPRLEEQVKWRMPSKPWGAAVWFLGGNVAIVDFLKNAVRVTFPKGALLEDPTGLFNARLTSKLTRAIDVPAGNKVDVEAFQDLIRKACELQLRS